MGFSGKLCLHINQVSASNRIFGPSTDEFLWAKKIYSLYSKREKVYQESFHHGPKFFGPPHELIAKNIINQSDHLKQSFEHPKPRIILGGVQNPTLNREIHCAFGVTIDPGIIGLWNSYFINTGIPLNSNRHLAQQMGFTDTIVRMDLVLALGTGMCVVKLSEKGLHLGYEKVRYHRPVYIGDTIACKFCIVEIKHRNKKTILKTFHTITNQNNQVVMTFEKNTYVPKLDIAEGTVTDYCNNEPTTEIIKTAKKNIGRFPKQEDDTNLKVGDIILHRMAKVCESSEVTGLSNLMGATNLHHFDKVMFEPDEIVVPGPLSISATLSNSSVEIPNKITEELTKAVSITKVCIGDILRTVSKVISITDKEIDGRKTQELVIVSITLKNVDITVLEQTGIPDWVFDLDRKKDIEARCITEIPYLSHKIVCNVSRKILRF
jgi:acyl dehydratase